MEFLQADYLRIGEVVHEGRSEADPALFADRCHGGGVARVVAAPAGVLVFEVAVDELTHVVGV